jgi:hypothetical protein
VNPQQSFMLRGVFGGLFVGIGALITMIGGIFSRLPATPAMTGYVYELLTVGVLSLAIGIGNLVIVPREVQIVMQQFPLRVAAVPNSHRSRQILVSARQAGPL